MSKVRVDKWIWSVRIFKSRTMASNACKANKVRMGEAHLKPSSQVQVGDIISVRKNGFDFSFEVLQLISKRVGASIAVECYKDRTSPEELNKYKSWFIGKSGSERREKGAGRPTKRERREIDDYKDHVFEEMMDWNDIE